ncbi:hypothetical protein SEA_PICKLES13_61 [Microbacterium phage Pickles13]|nr:hypothetical protein SEA_PICKLES13_61 [Microbacterium phage Pickles13]
MAAHMGDIEVGVTPFLSPEGKALVDEALEAFSGAFDAIVRSKAQTMLDVSNALLSAYEPKTTEAEREPLPGPTIEDWPIKSHPPVVIAPCPHCGSAIEANPVTWEIVVDPNVTTDATTVRGIMQHEHDGGVLVRWPFVATHTPTYTQPSVDDLWAPVDAPVIWDDPDVDIDEGQQKVDQQPWEFTPDGEGDVSLAAAVFQALGGASTCWLHPGATLDGAEFDGTRAREIGDALVKFIEQRIEQDERVQAWDAVASHPYLRPAFDTERTLLAAVLERLDEAARTARVFAAPLRRDGRS